MTNYQTKTRRPLIIAHRGASYDLPGNTMPAIFKAIKDGADVIEVDLRRTRDGEIILSHNELRQTQGSAPTLDELKKNYRDHKMPFCPPTLQEVFERVPKKTVFYLDIKEFGMAEDVIRLAKKYGVRAWYSGKQSLIFAYTPLLYYYPFVPVTIYKIFDGDMPCFIPERASIHYYEHVPSLVRFVHALGRKLFFWGVDTKAEMEKCINLGVDGILTDRPGALRELL